ncbi:phospholipase effector Tle1 domain-containing protein [Chryseobacterium oryctis]|uniref:DUF2235 domain-containing protein n=1 Tax=Chryseobacterium oryctis TaxID=2952618 RepID=A0ABT3HP18_9FLAO|nr:DUF2235 domain-containing protein [Chryseobacterium oryctis]MCW3161526.1 DUF2235 domain-containing protein [Chryseobacterium oryctis]
MSIQYFVEGKIKSQIKGDYLAYSKENIVHNTVISVEQKGNDTGVKYGNAEKINTEDKPTNLLDVSLNLFFDGTQNNKTNTELGKDYEKSNHEDDSYTNDYSNVARGYDAVDPNAENQVAEYIEGIGTEDGEGEMYLWGNVPHESILFGTGSRGVMAKVIKGCRKGAEKLAKYAQKDIHLKVNVFGFSRGATAARHFLHIANSSAKVIENSSGIYALSPKNENSLKDAVKLKERHPITDNYGYFGACLRYWDVIPQKITFNFVGLYDTVASYGLNHRGKGPIDGDTKQLGLNAVKKAYFVLQIASDDEFRDNFDLTNINSASVKGLEFTLPGVHSDIGGCYVNGSKEIVDLYQEEGSSIQCEKYRKILIDEGWYDPTQIYIQRLSPHREGVDARYILKGERVLFNIYDRISLNTMIYYSQQEQFGVKYEQKRVGEHKISDMFLDSIYNQLKNYMNACNSLRNTYVEEYNKTNSSGDYLSKIKSIHYEDFIDINDLKELRNKYLHWSANVTKIGYGPRVGKVANGKERKRNIQYG